MTEKQILNKIEEYLKLHSYNPVKINSSKLPPSIKSPDYEIYLKGKLDYYAEVKSPLLIANKETQMFHWRTSVAKLRDLIRKAIEQFEGVDKKHIMPWLLIFTSDHMQLNWTNMTDALTGVVVRGKTVIKDLRKERYVIDTQDDVNKIDLFVWFQMAKDGTIHQVRFFINADSKFKAKCDNISANLSPSQGEPSFNR